MRNKLTALLAVLVLLLVGISGGLIIGAAFTSNASASRDWEAELAAIDSRIAQLPPQQQAFVLVSRRATPAVVTIASERVVTSPRGNMQIPEEFRRFFDDDFFFQNPEGGRQQRLQGLGSGVIVDPDGIILTNNHVVERAETIQVTLPDRRTVDAEVVGTDPDSDLAVLRVNEKNLPSLSFGDSSKLEVGEWVVAIGNPFSESLAHTVTAGIVSGKGRDVALGLTYSDFIQTDAAINPGNSGGALVNMNGELIGINSAIATNTGTYNGIGFAIPSNLAKHVMDSLLQHGKVLRGWLGVQVQSVSNDMAAAIGLDTPRGALIASIVDDTPAKQAGLRRGDVILALNGERIESSQDLTNKVGAFAPGSEIRLTIFRDRGEIEMSVVLGERPADASASASQPSEEAGNRIDLIGLQVTSLTDDIAQRLGYEGEEGVVITAVSGGSVAERAGLRSGMLIQEINRRPIRSIDDFNAAMEGVGKGDSVLIYARAGNSGGYFAIKVPSN